jgi:hypothetical protein
MNTPIEYFVDKDSIVRKIWGKSDNILFIFAGAAAEFALNKAVDWLYFTGKLPAEPLGRLFSTVEYARQIVFAEAHAANLAIDKITAIHSGVEKRRNAQIPEWAYRDVLFMLIYYSLAAYELLERKLKEEEKEELFNVFYRVGTRMKLKGLPINYNEWMVMHAEHLETDLVKSKYTTDLYKQYKKHLGLFRYQLLLESQQLIAPPRVKELLGLHKAGWLNLILPFYKFSRKIKMDGFIKSMILPEAYKAQIKALDMNN